MSNDLIERMAEAIDGLLDLHFSEPHTPATATQIANAAYDVVAPVIEQHDKMGRLIAWIVDDEHEIPKTDRKTKAYIRQYMHDILTIQPPEK